MLLSLELRCIYVGGPNLSPTSFATSSVCAIGDVVGLRRVLSSVLAPNPALVELYTSLGRSLIPPLG